MQVTKGIWRMREQCVPGSLPPPPHKSLGTRLGSSQIVSGTDCVWAQILCLVDKICYPIIIQLATICRFCPSTLAETVWFHRLGLKLCYAASCMSVFH